MLTPTSEHLQIEPIKTDSFVQQQTDKFKEIGTVIKAGDSDKAALYQPGVKVYFDSWLAKKFPAPNGTDFYWFLHVDDVVAYETVDEALPK